MSCLVRRQRLASIPTGLNHFQLKSDGSNGKGRVNKKTTDRTELARVCDRTWVPLFRGLIFFLRKHFRVDEAGMLKTGVREKAHRSITASKCRPLALWYELQPKFLQMWAYLSIKIKNKCHIQDLRDLLLRWHLGRLGRHRAPCKGGQTEWDINWLYHAAATADEELSHGHVWFTKLTTHSLQQAKKRVISQSWIVMVCLCLSKHLHWSGSHSPVVHQHTEGWSKW